MSSITPVEGVKYFDAHLHRQDPDLIDAIGPEVKFEGIKAQVCNGTRPDDWQAVQDVSSTDETTVLKAYGVHPWCVDQLPVDWESQLRRFLKSGAASVGEIGLDHWIQVRDDRLQLEVFARQLQMAHEEDLVPSIHCLRAWGLLVDSIRTGPALRRGFLVHGFGGSKEVLFQLLDLGGHVSFSSYASDPGRKRMRDAIRACPEDRLLAETDAPDMVPPEDLCRFPIKDAQGQRLHHPLEIQSSYAMLAELRQLPLEELAVQLEKNFRKLFMG
ncbi:TatD family hydrolase [Puniceicoccales bacterium CK1056]|uniref:TatD family hydrolase n=1 Tax=Oceanipulchritudo coccoides TaxID=2706888 RepID=A0A6B2M0K1_9BACT|nr:TatD family hydrolase [Oceanipulchritudo coccoides]NDV61839.1 TatD family hydrolase [Oceanipulchritudo coccoides]